MVKLIGCCLTGLFTYGCTILVYGSDIFASFICFYAFYKGTAAIDYAGAAADAADGIGDTTDAAVDVYTSVLGGAPSFLSSPILIENANSLCTYTAETVAYSLLDDIKRRANTRAADLDCLNNDALIL